MARAKQRVLDQLPETEDGTPKQLPKKFQKYLKRCKDFPEVPPSLYPSTKMHQKVVKSQHKFLQKYLKQRQEEMVQHQKLMKLRNGKFMQLGSTPYPISGIGASVQH